MMTEKTNFSLLEGKVHEKLKTTTGKKLPHVNFRRQHSFEKKCYPTYQKEDALGPTHTASSLHSCFSIGGFFKISSIR
jgi:hypothetical protein